MKKLRTSAAALLLLALMLFGSCLMLSNPKALRDDFRSGRAQALTGADSPGFPGKLARWIAGANHAADEAADRQTALITLYGGFQRLIGCEIVQDASAANNVVRLKSGKLNFISRDPKPGNPDGNAEILNDFAAYNNSLGIPTLFVLTPQKISMYADEKPAGAVEYGNENANRFLSQLSPETSTLDLRSAFHEAERGHNYYFFDTDHHWTPEGAFLGFQHIAERLRTSYVFTIDSQITDLTGYQKDTYPQLFLGSQGKRVGPWYAGLDDFTLLRPAGATSGFSFEIPHKGVLREGSFEDAFLFYEMLETGDIYSLNPYVVYTGGDYPLSVARNANDHSGKKILLLKQSFSCALAPFLACGCSQLDILDPRYFEGSVRSYIAEAQPDLVMVVYGASDTCNELLFTPLSE